MFNSNSRFGVDRHFYMVSPSTHELGSFRDANFVPKSRTDSGRPSSLHWRNFGTDNRRERVTFSVFCPPGGRQMLSDTIRPSAFCLLRFHKITVPSRSEQYLLWKTRTSWSKRVRPFLLLFPVFKADHFTQTRTVRFYGTALIFQVNFFCFCNTRLFVTSRTSFDVAGPNIILLCNDMGLKSIRYTTLPLSSIFRYTEMRRSLVRESTRNASPSAACLTSK